MKNFTLLIFAIFSFSTTYAQVGINADNSAPHISAQLDVKSTTKAFYPPRMTTTQKNAIGSVQPGATVFDITLNQLSFYNGSAWVAAAGGGLTLPYNQSGSQFTGYDGGLFKVTNTLPGSSGEAVALNGTITGSDGFAIRAMATNTAGFLTGAIYATNSSTNSSGFGISGNHAGGGPGITGSSYSGVGVSGFSTSGIGIKGVGDSNGIKGESTGNSSQAVRGDAAGSDSQGVYGEANGDYGIGVYGNSNSTITGVGVWGNGGFNSSGIGTFGFSFGGRGVYGNTFNGYGVYGSSDVNIGGFFKSAGGYALITEAGNVGIGTLTPSAKMDIKGSAYLSHFYFGTNEDTYLRGGKAGSHVLINDIAGQGNVGIGLTNPTFILDVNKRIRIRHTVDETTDDNTAGIWYNNSANALGAFSGMKTDTEVGLFIGGAWRFWVTSGGAGYLNGALIQTSDKRLKKDFTQLNNSLTDIYKLNGYHFRWIEEARNKDLQTGFIAQEVQKIFPELVQTDEKGFLSVNYIGLIPHLLEAVKELKNENNSLKTENNSFKNSQTKLESRIDKMETLLNSFSKNTASN